MEEKTMLLKKGDTGNNVRYLQQGLRILCFNPKRLDGIFDDNTVTSVKNTNQHEVCHRMVLLVMEPGGK